MNKENRETRLKYWRKYNKQYNQKHRKERNEYLRNKNKIDLRFNINHKILSGIHYSTRRNKSGNHWEILVGYTLNDLVKRLKNTIPKGYIWQDYINGKLEIDHIIPKYLFNFTTPEHIDFKRCWALKNLRLLPAKENRTKHNKLSRPFQPALNI